MFPLFFALGLSLLPEHVACADMPSKATLATFGPSIEQISKTDSSETTFQPSSTVSINESNIRTTTNATSVSPASAPTVFGTVMGQSSVSGNGMTVSTSTTALACPGPTQIMNSSSTIEAIVQIQVNNFVGTVTVFLTQTGSSAMPFGMESVATSIATTTTEEDCSHSTSARGVPAIPSQSNGTSSGFAPRSNWTAGHNITNGSSANSPPPRTAFTVLTAADSKSHSHTNVPGMLPFFVFNVAVLLLL
ncbi:hypothetical protein EG328_006870 [Venturia inaequalis]|uniref:Uncharacterized protein n=1 Tax=Venturia inaequalis TaxID=5025 RepID=A0A8H3UF21_VENIN|nr:hypothetical protein EG328_006870 [Venturia inaequalis]